MTDNRALIASLIRDVPDFPKPGVIFKDITPLLASPGGYGAAISELVATAPRDIDVVVGMEARGFIFAGPVALALGAGFVPVRKPRKVPGAAFRPAFPLGYGGYEWKCNAQNRPSWQAALRLGFCYEGTFRQARVDKGHSRDTAWFSVIDGEWPALKGCFERWLADANFDEQGRQRLRLPELTAASRVTP